MPKQTRFRTVRQELGLSQEAAGRLLGVTLQTAYRWDSGKLVCGSIGEATITNIAVRASRLRRITFVTFINGFLTRKHARRNPAEETSGARPCLHVC
jgi:transcriptional regulator with XRE-family HTH domain